MSNIEFTADWLLLLPVIIFIAYRNRRLQLHMPRRALPIICLLLALCDPAIPSRRGGMDLWVLLDRSASTGSMTERQNREWLDLIDGARPRGKDRLRVIDYATDVIPAVEGGGTELSPSRRGKTRTSTAIEYVIANQDVTRPTRILAITDGYSTESLGQTASRLSAMGIPLDYRLISPPEREDFRISGFDGPTRVQAGEAFLLEARITAMNVSEDREIPITLLRDDRELASSTITIRDGRGSIQWTDRINTGGSHRYKVRIDPEIDAYAGNNVADTWVEISAGPRILVISKYTDDPLAKAFIGQGLEAQLITDPGEVSAATLTGAKAVVCNMSGSGCHWKPR